MSSQFSFNGHRCVFGGVFATFSGTSQPWPLAFEVILEGIRKDPYHIPLQFECLGISWLTPGVTRFPGGWGYLKKHQHLTYWPLTWLKKHCS